MLRRRNSLPNQRWTREQDLAVLYLKLEHQTQLEPIHPTSRTLAEAMNRSSNSILMRIRDFDSLDRHIPGKGLNHPAKLTKEIWAEYERNPERVLDEAQRAYLNLVH